MLRKLFNKPLALSAIKSINSSIDKYNIFSDHSQTGQFINNISSNSSRKHIVFLVNDNRTVNFRPEMYTNICKSIDTFDNGHVYSMHVTSKWDTFDDSYTTYFQCLTKTNAIEFLSNGYIQRDIAYIETYGCNMYNALCAISSDNDKLCFAENTCNIYVLISSIPNCTSMSLGRVKHHLSTLTNTFGIIFIGVGDGILMDPLYKIIENQEFFRGKSIAINLEN
jgi:hypothetical protein